MDLYNIVQTMSCILIFNLISGLEIPPPKKRKTRHGILKDVAEANIPKAGADGNDCLY